ncbi:MAG: hypothetical protein R2867_16815 [Caldilineaceae bacterium]
MASSFDAINGDVIGFNKPIDGVFIAPTSGQIMAAGAVQAADSLM